ncbi:preprotein translocase subunit YajC [Mesorhizobium sp. B2-5-7]|nr:preprotein translocase subunit YajC [Mesorhizobium sp. B2-5-7]
MLHYSVPLEFEIGDEVALTGTVTSILPSGRAQISIPSYGQPYSVDPPPKTHAGDEIVLVGDIIRVDHGADKLTVRIDCGGIITVRHSAITRFRRHRRPSSR